MLTNKDKFNNFDNLPAVVAHRGASGSTPENTLAALREACRQGASWVEVDTQVTGDGYLVIHHDYVLGRTVRGKGAVSDYTKSQLLKMDAGYWYSKEFSGEKIPSLEQLFDTCVELNLGINLEVKCRYQSLNRPTITALVQFLNHYPLKIPLEISSFNFNILYSLSQELPDLRLGLLIDPTISGFAQFDYWEAMLKAIHSYAIHLAGSQVNPLLVEQAKGAGYQILAYAADKKNLAKTLFEWGVDSVCTDFPGRTLLHIDKGEGWIPSP